MANRYWVGGTANWDGTAGTKWATTSGGSGGAAVPTSSDDVFFDAASGAVTVTVLTATALANNIDFTGFTGTFAGSVAMDVYGNLAMASGMTNSYTGTITFKATATGKTLTFAGKTMNSTTVFVGVGGGWTMQDAWKNTNKAITLTAGTLNTNGQDVTTASTIVVTGTTTRTLTLGASAISCNSWSLADPTNLTFNVGTSTITMTGSQTFAGGGLTYNNVVFTVSAALTGANTFANLTQTGAGTLTLSASQVITGTLTANGTSATSRILITTATPGVQYTLTAATVTMSNVDIQDIAGAGAGSWDLSAITGNSGDCGGNSGITFTTPATQTWSGTSGGSWTANAWTSRMPLPQDDVVIASAFSASQTITANTPRLGKNITFVGSTGSPTFATGTTQASVYGSLTLIAGMTVTGVSTYTFEGRGTHTFTTAGQALDRSLTFSAPGGSYTLQDALTMGTTRTLTLTAGTFDANGFNLSGGTFSSTGTVTRTLTMGSGTWTFASTGTVWNTNVATNMTLNPDTATIVFNNSSATARTISGSSLVRMPNVDISAGTGIFTLTTVYLTDLDFTGFSGSWATGVVNIMGNLTISRGMTVTDGANITTFSATSGVSTITTNGVVMNRPFNFDGVGGTWELQDAFTGNATRRIQVLNGHLDFNDKNVTIGLLTVNISCTLTMGAMTLELLGTGSTAINTNASATINAGTSTIKVTDTSSAAVTLALGGKTYYNVWFARGASTGSHTISGSNTFNELKDTGTAAHSMIFTNSSNTSFMSWAISGTAGNLITINSSGTAVHTLTNIGGGVVSADYLNIQHSVATPSPFYAGANSVDNQAVVIAGSGWVFTVPPAGNSFAGFFAFHAG